MGEENDLLLYEVRVVSEYLCPYLTVQWLPGREDIPIRNCYLRRMILGTYKSIDMQNYLVVAEVEFPLEDSLMFDHTPNDNVREHGKIEIVQKINHEGEIERARYMPQNTSIVATKHDSEVLLFDLTKHDSEVLLFDLTKHDSQPPSDGVCRPNYTLLGSASSEGSGLSWSIFKKGHLLSSYDVGLICLWDINAVPLNKMIYPTQIFQADIGNMEDVAWHLRNDNIFGSVCEDHYLHIWDRESTITDQPTQSVIAHQRQVFSLAFNPINEWILATGSCDKTIKVFDLRNLSAALYTFDCSKNEILQVEWYPKNESILASSGLEDNIRVWGLRKVGDMQPATEAEAEVHPPELLLVYPKHTSQITEFSWNLDEPWTMASGSYDKTLHVWKTAEQKHDLPPW